MTGLFKMTREEQEKAEELMNKLRTEIDHDRLEGQIVARHAPALSSAMRALPAGALVNGIIQGLHGRNDLSLRQLNRLQHQLVAMLWDALYDDE